MTATASPSKIRALYRSFLRELPSRGLASRSPLQLRIRSTIIEADSKTPVEHAEQFLQYVKAQRMYATLLERYNPGMGMDEEERGECLLWVVRRGGGNKSIC